MNTMSFEQLREIVIDADCDLVASPDGYTLFKFAHTGYIDRTEYFSSCAEIEAFCKREGMI